MSKSPPEDWPAFQAPLLNAICSAFRQRRKALAHQTRSFVATREADPGEASPPERLNLDAEVSVSEGKPVQVRLSVWPDGAMWFRACRPAKRGWEFMFAFHGQLPGPSTKDLVGWLESSLSHVWRADTERLLSVWAPVRPVVDHAA